MRIIEYNKIPAVRIRVVSEREILPSVFVIMNKIFIIFETANSAHELHSNNHYPATNTIPANLTNVGPFQFYRIYHTIL